MECQYTLYQTYLSNEYDNELGIIALILLEKGQSTFQDLVKLIRIEKYIILLIFKKIIPTARLGSN